MSEYFTDKGSWERRGNYCQWIEKQRSYTSLYVPKDSTLSLYLGEIILIWLAAI